MRLSELVDVSSKVAQTPSRLEKIATLSGCLRQLQGAETEIAVDYLTGRVRQGRLGVGVALLGQARTMGADTPSLTLSAVDAALADIARTVGPGSATQRRDRLSRLLAQATPREQEFLIRLLVGELRQGALEGVMVEAVARATQIPIDEVRRAVMVVGDLATVATVALKEGRGGLRRFALQLLQPVRPMLAQTADDVSSALSDLGRAALEYKIDGARVQVHKAGDEVRIFSRRLNDITPAAPEIVQAVRALGPGDLILDGEAIAIRPDGRPHPFQTTMRRFGRKLDVARLREELPLHVFFFDLLRVDDEDLIDRPAQTRFEILESALPRALLIPRLVTTDPEAGEAFLDQALEHGHEGVMAKSMEAPYDAGNRGSSWRKIKPAHTLDLAVLAAEWGHGRRSGWLSNLHLGARDPNGAFVMLGKTFKGMTDAMLDWQTRRLLELETARDAYAVYVRPELVVEVAFNDVQASPHYPDGLALRFARVKRYRPDKTAQEADSIDTVRAIFAHEHRNVEGERSVPRPRSGM
jgi:DNA ligase-1